MQNTDMESNTILYDSDAPTQTSTVANCSNWTGCPLDEADYIRSYLGWRYRGLCETVVLTTVYATILLTGVIGNASTCVVIATNRAMHSPTNFYLLSLAVSDVLTLCLGTNTPLSISFYRNGQHLSYDGCLEVRGEIIRTVLCCIVY